MPKFRRWLGRPAIAALSALAVLGLGTSLAATSASASTVVTASTSVTNHPDTTSASGGVCTSSPNGPVWAHDFYTSTITATQTGATTWSILIHDSGTFVAFADPTTCAALQSTGSLTGDYALTVTSAIAPTAAGLHASYDGPVSTTQMVLDFFGDAPTSSDVVGGDYTFTYVGGGGTYVQNTSGATGDVKAVACTVTLTKPADQTSVLNVAIAPLQIHASSNYPGTLQYAASNLPKGLSIDPATGKITGTPTKTGTSVVTVGAINPAHSSGEIECDATAQFDWTVSLTAPSPSPSPSSSSSPTTVPVGGVQTGAVEPAGSPWKAFGFGLAALAALLIVSGGVVALRRQRV